MNITFKLLLNVVVKAGQMNNYSIQWFCLIELSTEIVRKLD